MAIVDPYGRGEFTVIQSNSRNSKNSHDQRVIQRRTATMNASSDPAKEARKIHVHIVDVVEQKGEGYTVILQAFPESEITSQDVWSAALPGDFIGGTKVDRLWHLYYRKNPGYSPGDRFDLDLPEAVENE